MTRFLLRRIGQAIVVVFIVSVMTFLLLHLLPGGAARAELGFRASPASIRAFNKANGYNLPLVPQYFTYLDHLFHGNLGYSYKLNEPVSTLLSQDLPKSFYLSGLALFFTLIIAIPLGIYQAVRRNKPDDYFVTGMSFIGYSMPTFWLGLLLIAFFSIFLKWLPPSAPQSATVSGAFSDPKAMILPVMTLTIVGIAFFSRYMRSSAIESLAQDYIRTARAKGVTRRGLLFGHMLRNAILPVVTLIGLSVPALLSGNLITESVFNYPGVGLLFWTAAETRDYPTLLALTLVVAIFTVVGNLLADIGYGIIDRRVRVS
ncbi:MAG TPA: ABC transporter permease [Acidimicrobiales bacterium]|jgi:peptide/nickel transport system permease protein|nr:ABC transporter permease [Acidimicrobiales bacterium]